MLIFSSKTSCDRRCLAVNVADWVSSLFAYCLLHFGTANVSRMRALNEPKVAKFEEIRAEFGVFKSNAPGLKLNFCGPYVDMPNCSCLTAFVGWEASLLMHLQEPPRGDGASSSVNFLFFWHFVPGRVASRHVHIRLVKVSFEARSIALENARFCSHFGQFGRFRLVLGSHSAHISHIKIQCRVCK